MDDILVGKELDEVLIPEPEFALHREPAASGPSLIRLIWETEERDLLNPGWRQRIPRGK